MSLKTYKRSKLGDKHDAMAVKPESKLKRGLKKVVKKVLSKKK